MENARRTTIDSAGRVVVPKAVRRHLGLSGGQELDVSERDGVIELKPVMTKVHLVERGGVLVADVAETMPVLTAATVRQTLDGLRR